MKQSYDYSSPGKEVPKSETNPVVPDMVYDVVQIYGNGNGLITLAAGIPSIILISWYFRQFYPSVHIIITACDVGSHGAQCFWKSHHLQSAIYNLQL